MPDSHSRSPSRGSLTSRPNALIAGLAGLVIALSMGAGAMVYPHAASDHLAPQVVDVMDDLRAWPPVDMVLEQHPEFEMRIADAVRQDLAEERELLSEASKSFDVLRQLRNEHILPALRTAADDAVLDVWRTQSRALHYVAGWTTEGCVTFFDLGIVLLDREAVETQPELRNYGAAVMAALESASSNSGSGILPSSTVVEIWEEALSFRELHWNTLMRSGEANVMMRCTTALQMSTNLHLLPQPLRVGYARTIVSRHYM